VHALVSRCGARACHSHFTYCPGRFVATGLCVCVCVCVFSTSFASHVAVLARVAASCTRLFVLSSGVAPCALGGMKRRQEMQREGDTKGELLKDRAKRRRASLPRFLCYVRCLACVGLSVALWRCSISLLPT